VNDVIAAFQERLCFGTKKTVRVGNETNSVHGASVCCDLTNELSLGPLARLPPDRRVGSHSHLRILAL
jgi:hypothetical protein